MQTTMIIAATVIMAAASISDIRTHSISILTPLLLALLGGIYAFCFRCGEIRTPLLICTALCAVSFLGKESLGLGDSLCIGALSLFGGLRCAVFIVSTSAFFAVIYATVRLVRRKSIGDIPLIPFITAGFVCSVI